MINAKTKLILRGAALVLPTLLLGAAVWHSLIALESAPVLRLPVAGYDPVDILHGHYIRFRFDESVLANKPDYRALRKDDYCLCFHREAAQSKGQHAQGQYVLCSKKTELQCDSWVPNTRFFKTTHKYFVDERYALQLDSLAREAMPPRPTRRRGDVWVGSTPNPKLTQSSPLPTGPIEAPALPRITMDVAISPSGAIKLKMLNIDGKPWQEAVTAPMK